jgi:hypothetical protein
MMRISGLTAESLRLEQDVRRLEVAVDDVATVGRLQRRGDLAGESQPRSSQSLFALELGRQRLAIDVVHRDEPATAVELAAAEEPHDPGMVQRRDRLGFVEKPRQVLLDRGTAARAGL